MIEVKLISHTEKPLQTIAAAINQCYSTKTGTELQKEITKKKAIRLIDLVTSAGHLSTLEHANFTFSVSGVSRITETQLVRHRLASYSIKSGRYNKAHLDFVIPPQIEKNSQAQKIIKKYKDNLKEITNELKEIGFKSEDIRFFSPQGTKTNILVTMNARELLHFFEKRLCLRAMWEIREMAQMMLNEVNKILPEIFQYSGPTCKVQKICWEGKMNCGLWKTIEGAELKSRV